MRVIFVNLEENGFYVRSLRNMLFKRKTVAKHAFLLKWLLDNNVEVIDYITPNYGALPSTILRHLTNKEYKKAIRKIRFYEKWVYSIKN